MKPQRNILILEVITLTVVIALFSWQILTLPTLRYQIKSGLHTSQEKIARLAAEGLDKAFRKEVLRGAGMLRRKLNRKGLYAQDLERLRLDFRRIAVAQPLSNAWLTAFPDPQTGRFISWEFKSPSRYRPGGETVGSWRTGTELTRFVEEELQKLVTPFVTLDSFATRRWANSLDSSIVFYYNREFSSDILVGTPFFAEDSTFTGFLFTQTDTRYLEEEFIPDYLNTRFLSLENEWEGIEKKFLHLGVLSGRGNQVIYQSVAFGRKNFEHIVPLASVNSWLPGYSIGIGFRNATVEEVGDSIYQRNFYFFITLFVLLLVLLVLVFRSARRLSRLSRLKSEFVANVSHEIKSPLASIRLAADTLRLNRTRSPEQMDALVNILHKEATRLDNLVHTLLDFSQMEAGKKPWNLRSVSVQDWWQATRELFRDKCGEHLFHVDTEAPAGSISIDRSAIDQVLTILLDNALKYSPDQKKIEGYIRREGKWIRVSVRDHGIGIARQDLSGIFDKFTRIGNLDVHNVKGYGIGLSIAKTIMKAHQGRIEVESKPGEGSTFTLVFTVEKGT